MLSSRRCLRTCVNRGLPPLSLVPVITREVDVDPNGSYEGLPHFSHFGDQIKFVGGVNRPKLIQASFSTTLPYFAIISCDTVHEDTNVSFTNISLTLR